MIAIRIMSGEIGAEAMLAGIKAVATKQHLFSILCACVRKLLLLSSQKSSTHLAQGILSLPIL